MNVAVSSYPRRALAIAAVAARPSWPQPAPASPMPPAPRTSWRMVVRMRWRARRTRVSAPFASIQRALACAGDGDVISLGAQRRQALSRDRDRRGQRHDQGGDRRDRADGHDRRQSGPAERQPRRQRDPHRRHAELHHQLRRIAPTVTNQGQLLLLRRHDHRQQRPAQLRRSSTPPPTTPTPRPSSPSRTRPSPATPASSAARSRPTAATGATGASTLNITNSTIANNVSLGQGGGIAALASTPGSGTTITNTTITGNTASSGGGLYASSPVTLTNTIIAANKAHPAAPPTASPPRAAAIITDGPGGHNLIGNPTGCGAITPGTNNDQTGVSHPGLLALANNGGTTNTVGLQAASPAIAAGDPATCESGPFAGSRPARPRAGHGQAGLRHRRV